MKYKKNAAKSLNHFYEIRAKTYSCSILRPKIILTNGEIHVWH